VLELRVLGELQVVRDGVVVPLPASKKTRALLGYLAVTGRQHQRDALCSMFWDGPGDARAGLRWSLSKLRPVIDDDIARLVADRDHVGVELRPGELDLARLRRIVRADLDHAPVTELERAVADVRDEPLCGLDLHDCWRWQQWCAALREEAQGLHRQLLVALVHRLADDPTRALPHARTRASVDPFDESAHAAVIGLLGRLGRMADALREYEAARRLIPREAPGGELERARWQLGRASPAVIEPLPPSRPEAPRARAIEPDAPCGRAPEIARFVDVLDRVGSGEVVLVAGDPGIGKSTVLHHFGELVRARGGCVLGGRAFEAEMVRPYGAWIDALRAGGLADEIVPLARDAGERARFFDAVVELLRGIAAPCLVVLDDVQWLDEAGSALLHYAARALADTRVTLVCGARTGELADNPGALRTIRALLRDRKLVRIDLGALDADTTSAVLRVHGLVLDDDAGIFADSGGNPLFALELARARALGSARSETLDELIRARLDALPATARELVAWAAAFGRTFADDQLMAVTGLPAAELLTALDELDRRGIVVPRFSDGAAGHDFVHDLVRDVAYRLSSESRRRASHLQIARVLAALPDPDHALAGDVARHAALGRDASLCAHACVRAATRCLELFATREVRELVGLGRGRLVGLPVAERVGLEIRLLHLAIMADGSRRDALEDDLSRAIEEAQHIGAHDDAAFGLYALSIIHHGRGDYDGARTSSLRADAISRKSRSANAAQACARTGLCLALLERDLAQADTAIAEAESILADAGTELADAILGRALLDRYRGRTAAAIEGFERALALGERGQNHYSTRTALLGLARVALEQRALDDAFRHAKRLRDVALLLSEGSERQIAETIEALAALMRTPTAGSMAVLEAALQGLRDVDHRAFLSYALELAGTLDLERGHRSRAAARAEESLVAARAVKSHNQIALAHVLLARLAEDDDARAAHMRDANELRSQPEELSARVLAALAEMSD
jgi:DNA-binding SARP family transcriptional activator/tetratricopeptide (TPR) repeat protein